LAISFSPLPEIDSSNVYCDAPIDDGGAPRRRVADGSKYHPQGRFAQVERRPDFSCWLQSNTCSKNIPSVEGAQKEESQTPAEEIFNFRPNKIIKMAAKAKALNLKIVDHL
jgi:hypothetical protein